MWRVGSSALKAIWAMPCTEKDQYKRFRSLRIRPLDSNPRVLQTWSVWFTGIGPIESARLWSCYVLKTSKQNQPGMKGACRGMVSRSRFCSLHSLTLSLRLRHSMSAQVSGKPLHFCQSQCSVWLNAEDIRGSPDRSLLLLDHSTPAAISQKKQCSFLIWFSTLKVSQNVTKGPCTLIGAAERLHGSWVPCLSSWATTTGRTVSNAATPSLALLSGWSCFACKGWSNSTNKAEQRPTPRNQISPSKNIGVSLNSIDVKICVALSK